MIGLFSENDNSERKSGECRYESEDDEAGNIDRSADKPKRFCNRLLDRSLFLFLDVCMVMALRLSFLDYKIAESYMHRNVC